MLEDKESAESIPAEFRDELVEYLNDLEANDTPVKNGARLNLPSSEDEKEEAKYLNTTFKHAEKEDNNDL